MVVVDCRLFLEASVEVMGTVAGSVLAMADDTVDDDSDDEEAEEEEAVVVVVGGARLVRLLRGRPTTLAALVVALVAELVVALVAELVVSAWVLGPLPAALLSSDL